jgi:hypothetical protein
MPDPPAIPDPIPVVPSSPTATTPVVTVRQVPRELTMHSVTEEELHTLRAIVPVTCLTFLGVAFGTAIAFYTVLKSSGLTAVQRANFHSLFFYSRIATVLMLIISVAGYIHLFRVIHRIESRRDASTQ